MESANRPAGHEPADRPDPRAVDDAAQLGALDGALPAPGYEVLAPAYPGLEVEVEALREDPSPIANLRVPETVAHLESVIRELDQPPFLMGHSYGGLLTQLLLDRGLGAAGVAIDSAPPEGVRKVPPAQIKASSPRSRTRPTATARCAHAQAVPLRVQQHPQPRRSQRRSTSAITSRAGPLRLGRLPGQRRARSPGHLGELQERRASAAAVHRRRRRPRHARGRQPLELRALQVGGAHRLQGVRGPQPLHGRPGGVGGGRRLRAQLVQRAHRPRCPVVRHRSE